MKTTTKKLDLFFSCVILLFLTGVALNCSAQSDSLTLINQSIDTLRFDNFNGEGIPIISSKKKLISKFGKPSLIKSYKVSKGGKNHSKITYYSFLNSDLKYFSSGTKYILSSLFFVDTISHIVYDGIVFSNNTTLSKIKEDFVNSYQLRYEYPLEFILSEKSPKWNIYKNYPLICVPFVLEAQFKLDLFFSNEKLVFIDVSEL